MRDSLTHCRFAPPALHWQGTFSRHEVSRDHLQAVEAGAGAASCLSCWAGFASAAINSTWTKKPPATPTASR